MAREHAIQAAVVYSERVVGAVLGSFTVWYVARTTPGADTAWGLLGTGLAFSAIFVLLAGLFDGAHLRLAVDRPGEHGRYARLKLASLVVFAVASLGFLWAWTDVFGLGFGSDAIPPVLLVLMASQIVQEVGVMGLTMLRAEGRFGSAVVPVVVGHGARTLAIVVVAGSTSPLAVPTGHAIGMAAMTVSALIMGVPVLVRSKGAGSTLSEYAHLALPSALGGVLHQVLASSDRLIVQFFWTAREVGFLFAPLGLHGLLQAIIASVAPIMRRQANLRYANGEPLEPLTGRTLRAAALVVLPGTAFLVALPEAVIHVFLSDTFLPAAPVIRWLALGTPLLLVQVTSGTILGAKKEVGLSLALGAGGVAINLLLNLVLVPITFMDVRLAGLGATGAAMASTATQVFLAAVTVGLAVRRGEGFRVATWRSFVWQAMVAVGLGTFLAMVTPANGSWAHFSPLLALAGMTLTLHVLLAWRWGLEPADRVWLRSAIARP